MTIKKFKNKLLIIEKNGVNKTQYKLEYLELQSFYRTQISFKLRNNIYEKVRKYFWKKYYSILYSCDFLDSH